MFPFLGALFPIRNREDKSPARSCRTGLKLMVEDAGEAVPGNDFGHEAPVVQRHLPKLKHHEALVELPQILPQPR